MTDQANGNVTKHSKAANDCRIIPELSVSMDLDEILADEFHVIEEVGTLRMPCELYLLVRREVIHI